MSFSLIPKLRCPSIYQITPELLLSRGITLLLMDLDNTLSTYDVDLATDGLLHWMDTLQSAGIDLFLVSNNRTDRAAIFAESAGLPLVKRAKKPSPRGLLLAMERAGKTPEETAMVGDQIFTDVLGANRAGVFSIVVKPLAFMPIRFALRYGAEIPFRLLAKEKCR